MDAVAFLHRSLEPASADLIVAADVTVYMRSLEGLMQGTYIIPTLRLVQGTYSLIPALRLVQGAG